jgi:Tat protein secretion system quality control protein TatD with DNase activity
MTNSKTQLDALLNALGAQVSPDRQEQIFESFLNVAKELEKLRSLDLHDVHPAVLYRPQDIVTGDKDEL